MKRERDLVADHDHRQLKADDYRFTAEAFCSMTYGCWVQLDEKCGWNFHWGETQVQTASGIQTGRERILYCKRWPDIEIHILQTQTAGKYRYDLLLEIRQTADLGRIVRRLTRTLTLLHREYVVPAVEDLLRGVGLVEAP